MTEKKTKKTTKKTTGYHQGSVDTVMSVDAVEKAAADMAASRPSKDDLWKLAGEEPFLMIEDLVAGYGAMEILHSINLAVGKGQSLCLIGPNGAGKSTILHSIYGFTDIKSGKITSRDVDVTRQKPNQKLAEAGIAYILQDNSVFPDMTVRENLLMGGYLMKTTKQAAQKVDEMFDKYDRLAARANQPARILSGGERRLLEISRALVMDPDVLLVDEPSIGLEPRYIDMVFDILEGLQKDDGKTIIMVEQNARKGLEFADLGYVLVAGEVAMADTGDALLANPDVGRLFLGG
ncbi:MAG: ABC transporter ATP-binding protein [Alphaproteobacteria bacterium]|nr:ABC transporter ATP-binding protein [Alphaproteobacteria bacterium]